MAHSTPAMLNRMESTNDLSVSVGLIAERLIRSIRGTGDGLDTTQRSLLERALAVAAEAEQRLSEQNRRVAVLEMLTQTDELTGLLNRRGFDRELRRVLASARRYDEAGVVCFIDLDDFKSVNDIHGHIVGDRVLHTVGRILQLQVRENDIVARVGGDEFAVLLGKCTTEHGVRRARQIERVLNEHSISCNDAMIAIRGSVGITPYDAEDEAEALIRRADQAMYAKKRARTAAINELSDALGFPEQARGTGD